MATSTGLVNQEKLHSTNCDSSELRVYFRWLGKSLWKERYMLERHNLPTTNVGGIYLNARLLGQALLKRSIFHPVYIGPIFGDKYVKFAESNATLT